MILRIFIIASGLFVIKGSVILSPSPALAAVGESFTWTCTYSGIGTVAGFAWLLNGNTSAIILSPSCTPFAKPPNSTLYDYACLSTSQATFTVKQISNMNNGNSWQCAVSVGGYINSNNVTVTVQVSVNNVSLTPPTGSIRENVETTFTCETSTSRPAANISWYKESITGKKQVITSGVSSTTESVGDLEKATSVLKYTPSRSDNTYKIYCQALNIPGRTPVMSTKFQMDVQYSPESAPYIQNYSNGSTYKVIENNQGLLSCIIKGGNPLATLTWTCFNNGLSTEISGTTVTKTVTWSATRRPDRSCTCQSSHPIAGTQSVSVSVQVLYEPDRPTFKVKGTTVSGLINFIDGNSSSVVCESNGKPNPDSYSWNKAGSSTIAGDTLTFNPVQKQDDGQYTCTARNTMVPSSGDTQIGSNTSTVKINVLFPPSSPSLHYGTITGQQIPGNTVTVIKDVQFTVVCKSEANPEPAYTWIGQTAGNASLTITINEENQKKTCTATNTMMETQGVTQQGSNSSFITFIMLYPPEIKDCKLQYNKGSPISVSNNIDVKEFRSFTITCSVNSKPEATTTWLGPITSSTKTLNVNRVNRQQKGTYTIFASNRMEPTFGGMKRGNNTNSFNFNILYAPKITTMDNQDIVAGSNVSVQCPVTKGNPESTTFKWTRNGDSTSWDTQTLSIQNVTKNDDMMYTCTVQNIMKPTGSLQEIGTDSGSFHLNVLYMASITSFVVKGSQNSSVTVNEKADITFTCTVDSNPGSSIVIQLPDKMPQRKENATALSYNHTGVSCLDTGVYTCSASNPHNNGKAEKKLSLFVRCYPRPLTQVKENVTSALRVQSSFIFKGLAYPIPIFTWFRKQETTWKKLSSDSHLSISISEVDTNLTITNVSQSDYGEYQLRIENEIDIFIQNYTLIPEGVPETPSEFKVIEEHVSDTSVLLQWKPGFDGGPEQNFILMYKKASDHKWMNQTVRDTKNNVMNYTLDNLASESEYQVVIFSQNKVGDSVGRKNITFMTKVTASEPSNGNSALIGGAAGGGAGLVLILLIVGFITLRRKGFFTKGKAYREEENSDRKPVHSAEDDYGMQDNPMYVSAGPRNQTTGGSGSSDAGAVYSTVDKERNKIDTNKNDVYAEVDKSKKTKKDLTDVYSSPVKPKGNKDKKEKKGFLKDKKNKKMTHDVDIYENATTTELKDTTAKQKKNDEIIYENPEPTKQAARKNVNKDGLIYADLTFNDQPKGQKKLVIHGLDDMTEYVQVDFTKKAEPLPDSDDENNPPK